MHLSGWARGLVIAVLIVLSVWAPIQLAAAASTAVPLFHVDGAFQTFNGLLRFSSGELPGRDFFPYLGIGPLAILLPVFTLLGSTVASSVFAATLMTVLTLQAIFGILASLVFRSRSVVFALLAALVPTVAVHLVTVPLLSSVLSIEEVINMSSPGFSLRPLRAFAPYLLVLAAFAIARVTTHPTRRVFLMGVAAGAVAVSWSNDYGLISSGLLLVLMTFGVFAFPSKSPFREAVVVWISATMAYLAVGLLVTGGKFLSLLEYNFVDVRGDQYWYFAPWDTSTRINSAADLFWTMQSEDALWSIALLLGVASTAVWRRDRWGGLLSYLGLSLLLGGVVATVGGHADGYFAPFRMWASVTTIFLLARVVVLIWTYAVSRIQTRSNIQRLRFTQILQPVLVLVIAIPALVLAITTTNDRLAGEQRARENAQLEFNSNLGGYLDRRFAPHMKLAPRVSNQLLEEYSGLLTAVNGPRTDAPVDSVIHALGSQRGKYQKLLASRPDTVVTSSIEMSEWFSWNLSANWWFYRDLFKSYTVEQSSPNTYVWHPTQDGSWPSVACEITKNAVRISASNPGLYEVTVGYQGPGGGSRTFSMIRNNINFVGDAAGYVSLDPSAKKQAFPAYHEGDGDLILDLKNVGPLDTPVTMLTWCSASRVNFESNESVGRLYGPVFAASSTPADFSDINWTAGVGNGFAAFFMANTPANRSMMQDITFVMFSDGQSRGVTAIQVIGPYMNVLLDGPALDPATAGFPNEFSLTTN